MGLRSTFRPRIGPFRFNTGRRGVTSVSVGEGPFRFRLWGRDRSPGLSSVDLPGPVSWRPNGGHYARPAQARQQPIPQRPQRPSSADVPGPLYRPSGN